MSSDGLNTIDPEVAERLVSDYERNEAELVSYAARCREGRKTFTERRKAIADRAVNEGLNRKAFLDEIKERALRRKIEALKAGDDPETAEQRELLKTALGGLPLGDWGVDQMPARPGPRKSAAIPGAVPDPDQMTLAEAHGILLEPKKRGRQSAADKARRAAAERVVAEEDRQIARDAGLAEGASGAQAAAMADAMEAGAALDDLEGLAESDNDNPQNDDRDLRPTWMRGDDESQSLAAS